MTKDSDSGGVPFEIEGKYIKPSIKTEAGWSNFLNKMHNNHSVSQVNPAVKSQPTPEHKFNKYEGTTFVAHLSEAEDEKDDEKEKAMRKAMGLRDD